MSVFMFQTRVGDWVRACLGDAVAADRSERNFRFLEEAVELVQANGMTPAEANAVFNYVFCRPAGETRQEVGGVMVTLAALCEQAGVDMLGCAREELRRIEDPSVMDGIRAKQAAKPKAISVAARSPETRARDAEDRG